MRFIEDIDYSDQIRDEILECIDDTFDSALLQRAEQKAIAQIKMRLSGRYDVDKIFSCVGDDRDDFIVMTVIDIALYHLWSKERGKMPQIRNERYQDAIDWLKAVSSGQERCNLPELPDEDSYTSARIWSTHAANDHKY